MRPFHVTGLLLTSVLFTASAVAATPKTAAAPSARPCVSVRASLPP